MIYDYCIIGGGIVGVATATALLRKFPGISLVLLEKEDGVGKHQTGRNSGVIHSGIYYTPGSLKAKLCREGAARTKDFCNEHDIPFQNRGKLIVAVNDAEITRLDALFERAGQNGIEAELLTENQISEREPNVVGRKAIFVPAAAIVDYKRVLAALVDEMKAAGGEILTSTAPVAIKETGDLVEIACGNKTISAKQLVACAGLQSDRLAKMAGIKIRHRIVPFRGEYYRLSSNRNDIVGAMIYPVPEPGLPFLGTHLTPMIDGSITIGPNALLGLAREGYPKGSISLRDLFDTVSFPGFWKSIAQNIGPGLHELGNALFKTRYLEACRKYCPSLVLDDLLPMQCGIRAQAINRDGSMVDDFLFLQTDRMLHVCNAPSPAATSALPIADMIVDRLKRPS